MVQINFAQKQVNAKIVYYGPGMSGKTTNLEVIHQRAPEKNRGDLTSISTDGDRTLFFDFMPLDLGTVAGMKTCFQIYTVPGQVYYNSTRKLVLQGVDGVVFVADSSASMVQENLESLRNLEENLNEYGKSLANLPLVIQYNKRDLPDALPVEELHQLLNKGNAPTFEGIANTGQGVFPTLKALAGLVLDQIHQSYGSQDSSPAPENAAGGGFAAPAPAPAAPMGSTGFYPGGQGAPGQPAPAPHAAPPPAAVPSPAAQTQTGFHQQPQLVNNAHQQGAPQHGAPQQMQPQGLHQTGFNPQQVPNQQAQQTPPQQSPQQGYGGGQAPNQFGVDPLAATGVHAPPQFQQPQQPQQPVAGSNLMGQEPQAAGGGLRMARPQEFQSQPSPHGGAQAPQMQGGSPGGMMQQVQAPGGYAQGQAGAQAGEGPRLRPRASGRPAPAEAGRSKRSAVLTSIFVVAALAVGAVLGRLVLSLF